MTQPNICKYCNQEESEHTRSEKRCMKSIFIMKTSFTPEKESQSSDASLSDKPESREHTLSCNVEKLSISQDSSKSGISILTAEEIIAPFLTIGRLMNIKKYNKINNDNRLNEKFIPLSILESKKAEIEKGCGMRQGLGSPICNDMSKCDECLIKLSLLNELMEIKQ